MNKKALFIWIPKCGGSSIASQFKLNQQIGNDLFVYNFDNNSNVTFGHADINILLKKNILSLDFYKKSFKFCVVRNPYDRAISLFFFLRLHKKYSFKNWVNYLYKNKNYIPKNSHRNVSYYEIKNNKWQLVIGRNPYGIDCISNPWNPMCSWIPDDIDKIYYFEELDNIVNDVNKVLGIKDNNNNKIIHKNKSQHNNYREYYDNDTRNKIYEIYKEDFVRFNYSINL